MKIVFITQNYPPTICGVGDHTFHLAKEMSNRGIEVHVVCGAGQKTVNLYEINVHPIIKRWNTEGVRTITKTIANIRPDWVVMQYVPYTFHSKGLAYRLISLYRELKKLNIDILTVFHEIMIRSEHSIKKAILSFFQTQIAHILSEMSSKVVTSIDFYSHVLKKWHFKMALIPIGSNILPININPEWLQNLRLKYGINDTSKVICTFGNRNISTYLEVFDNLKKEYPNLIWLICGRTSTPEFVLKSRNYIRYTGEMSANNIYQHLALGDVFFMPDFVSPEGEGGTCNKSGSLACAFSLGIPIIGTKGDMNNALLKHNENILLIDISNKTALLQAFKKCFDSEIFSAELGKNALKLYENKLKWDVLSDNFLAIMSPITHNQAVLI